MSISSTKDIHMSAQSVSDNQKPRQSSSAIDAQTQTQQVLETKHRWLPVILAAYLPISFIITYAIAVANDHVAAGFPFISEAATRAPESCVFAQLVNIGAVKAGIIVYIRYRHIDCKFSGDSTDRTKCIPKLNTAAFILGLFMVLGVSIVGNFQETNNVFVHLSGAGMAFGLGFVYMVLQTVLSFKTGPDTVPKNAVMDISGNPLMVKIPGNSRTVCMLRVVLCVLDCILLIVFVVFWRVSYTKGPGINKSKFHWSEEDPGYAEHLVATISEWLVAFVTVAFIATFYAEFKNFGINLLIKDLRP